MATVAKRFYFDIETDDDVIKDDQGVESDSLEHALKDARSVIQEMVDQLNDAGLSGDSILIVRDESGSTMCRMAFHEILGRTAGYIFKKPAHRRIYK